MTPLHIASANGHVETVRALVELGAAVNQAKVGLVDMSLCVPTCAFVVCACECCCGPLVWKGVVCVVVDKGGAR